MAPASAYYRHMKRALLAALCATLAAAGVAVSAIPRPSSIAPKNGASLTAGKTPTFKFRSSGAGTHWVHVSKSKKRDAEGVVKSDAAIGQARKSGGVWKFKPKYYDYPAFWANQRGKTFYWQAFRISCGEEDDSNDCKIEGPVRRFKLR
jgi:hypothetical protein